MSENRKIRLTELVAGLPSDIPFVGPEEQERASGKPFLTRLGANENVFGPSPLAVEAMRQAAAEIWQYGDAENHELRTALASHHDVALENVVVGGGIDGLLSYTARLFTRPGTNIVTSLGSYPTFNYHVNGFGGTLHFVAYENDHENPAALLEKAKQTNAVLLYFSNPNNPMGTWWPQDVVVKMIGDLPDETVLVLDEAYGEFAPENTMPPIDVSMPNVLRFRTFSKAYGMAGARVGYAIGHHELIHDFEKVRDHFGMNRTAQIGALHALRDSAHLALVQEKVARARERLYAIAAAHGLTCLPSAANFVTIDCGRDSKFAKAVLEGLVSRGIFVRMPGYEPQSRCIRVSVGSDRDLDLFEKTFATVLAACG